MSSDVSSAANGRLIVQWLDIPKNRRLYWRSGRIPTVRYSFGGLRVSALGYRTGLRFVANVQERLAWARASSGHALLAGSGARRQ